MNEFGRQLQQMNKERGERQAQKKNEIITKRKSKTRERKLEKKSEERTNRK